MCRSRRSEMRVVSMVADEARKLPGKSVTAVLQHVSGGAIVRISAFDAPACEAKFVGRL